MVLNWMENRPRKEIPPRWMWHLDHELEAWFERIDEERDRSSPSNDRGDVEAPMMKNALTAGMRR